MAFFDIYTRMDETLAEKSSSETLRSGLKRTGIFFGIIGLLTGLAVAAFLILSGKAVEGIIGFVLAFAGILIGGVAVMLVVNLLNWIAAKLLGGRGEFGRQFGTMSLPMLPSLAIFALAAVGIVIAVLLMIIPIIGWIIGFILIALIYFAYLVVAYLHFYFYIAFMKEVHDLTTFRAVLAISMASFVMIVAFYAVYFAVIMLTIGASGLAALGRPPTSGFIPLG